MRKGQRTVLSMQNNYQGPPENFAMVIPGAFVLEQDNVKTLAPELLPNRQFICASIGRVLGTRPLHARLLRR